MASAWRRLVSPSVRHLKILDQRPVGALPNDAAAKALLRWAAAERAAWLEAVTSDPLLPGRILPSDYLGQQALVAVRKDRRRVEVLRDANRQLRTFKPE
jgi:DNA-binding transcriptional regulator PaaX